MSAVAYAWVNNNNAFTATLQPNSIMIDLASYESYLGIKKIGASPDYEDEFHGFIWELLLKQEAYNSPATLHFQTSSPCSSLSPCPVSGNDVTTDDWAQYNGDGTSCGTNCDYIGCRRAGDCITTADCIAADSNTGDKQCNLCYDRECAKCSSYDDSCLVCGIYGNAYLSGANCVCNTGYSRPNESSFCRRPCHTNCKECDD